MTNDTRDLISFDTLFIAGVQAIKPVGSRATCSVYSDEADYDNLVLCGDLSHAVRVLGREGFSTESMLKPEYTKMPNFVSMRRGMLNLIITQEKQFYEKFVLATHVARSLDLLNKEHRICLFQAILYGNTYLVHRHALDTNQAG